MEEKQEHFETEKHKECNCHNSNKTENTIKFILLLLALFLASYLAVYYVSDQIRHSYYIPRTQLETIDNIIKEQDKLFNEISTFPMQNRISKELSNPIEMYKNDAEDAYKIVINLKEFGNNTDNIKLNITDKEITINGSNETYKKNSEKHYEFSQNIVFPEKIDKKQIKKEIKRNKYIITLPIDD